MTNEIAAVAADTADDRILDAGIGIESAIRHLRTAYDRIIQTPTHYRRGEITGPATEEQIEQLRRDLVEIESSLRSLTHTANRLILAIESAAVTR